ncbi:MAG: hypothetical protein JO301_00045 [Chitinophagaceae bacterium]|nr:hypothetical protein [Chitinophagaceae bacterium]
MKKHNKFNYHQPRKISTWGFSFDSLTELKYAISIMEEYAFLRAPVSIYYHPGTLITLDQVRRCHLRYTPDFLIRHKRTHKAFLVEVKPRAFAGHPQLDLRRKVAENYISRKRLDWQFKVVYDDEISLTEEQLIDFETCAKLRSKKDIGMWLKEYQHRMTILTELSIHSSPTSLTEFVLSGSSSRQATLW